MAENGDGEEEWEPTEDQQNLAGFLMVFVVIFDIGHGHYLEALFFAIAAVGAFPGLREPLIEQADVEVKRWMQKTSYLIYALLSGAAMLLLLSEVVVRLFA